MEKRMFATIAISIAFFLIAIIVAEFLFRVGQSGVIMLGTVFGFNNFRAGELPRVPFYGFTIAIATCLTMIVIATYTTIS